VFDAVGGRLRKVSATATGLDTALVSITMYSGRAQGLVDVQSMITVVDAELVVDDTAGFGDIAFDQINLADMVVINKTDLVSKQQVADLSAARAHLS
jgi:G3E family GTPase